MAVGYGARIREAIKWVDTPVGSRYTQADLARALGVQGYTVSRWIGETREPSLEEFARLADILHVDAAWLAFGKGKGPTGTRHTAPVNCAPHKARR